MKQWKVKINPPVRFKKGLRSQRKSIEITNLEILFDFFLYVAQNYFDLIFQNHIFYQLLITPQLLLLYKILKKSNIYVFILKACLQNFWVFSTCYIQNTCLIVGIFLLNLQGLFPRSIRLICNGKIAFFMNNIKILYLIPGIIVTLNQVSRGVSDNFNYQNDK